MPTVSLWRTRAVFHRCTLHVLQHAARHCQHIRGNWMHARYNLLLSDGCYYFTIPQTQALVRETFKISSELNMARAQVSQTLQSLGRGK